MEKEFEYEGYTGTVNYDKNCDYYTGEVVIDGKIYTYEGDTIEELREDFEDIIDSMRYDGILHVVIKTTSKVFSINVLGGIP